MLLTSADISSLDTFLNRWEWVEYVSEAFVTLGCVGEFISEFTKIRNPEWRQQLSKVSLLVLIVSLAIELGALVRTNGLSGQEIALLNGVAADTRTRAAQLEIESASLLKQLIAQGSRASLLYGERRERLIEELKPFAGQKAEVRYCNISFTQSYIDQEAMAVASLLQYVLSSGSKWSVNPLVREACSGTGLFVEIHPKAPESTRKASDALLAALSRVPLITGGAAVGISDAPRPPQLPMFEASSGKEILLAPLGVDTIVITVLAHPL